MRSLQMMSKECWLTVIGSDVRSLLDFDSDNILTETQEQQREAMRYYGLKHIKGLTIETWHFAQEDCETIKNGLLDAYGKEVLRQRVNLFIHSTGEWHVQLPLEDLNSIVRLHERAVTL